MGHRYRSIISSVLTPPPLGGHDLCTTSNKRNTTNPSSIANHLLVACIVCVSSSSSIAMATSTTLLVLLLAGFIAIASAAHYVATPGGWSWSECVFEVESSSHIIDLHDRGAVILHPNGTSTMLPRCKRPFLRQTTNPNVPTRPAEPVAKSANGWQAWTAYNNAGNLTFDAFLGFFDVPAAPISFPGARRGTTIATSRPMRVRLLRD
jgi:hypothetical protein